jgi:catechol 2,3-dioxygenase-like lactoylglutathione lyase family enzyme
MSETQSRTRITQVGTVMVTVTDQDRAIDFYTSKLGFELRGDTPYGEGERWVEVAPRGAATTIALVPEREGSPAGGHANLGLTSDDIDADHAHLKEQGVDVDDVMRMGGPVPPMFFFRDQDGNTLLAVDRGS